MTGSGVRCNLTLAERSLLDSLIYILISEVGVRGRSHVGIFLGSDSGRITLKQLQKCLKTVLKNDPKNAPKRTTTHHNTAQHTQNTHNVHHEQLLRHVSTTYQHTYCVHLAVRLYYALHLAVRLYYALTFMYYVHFVLNAFGCSIDHFDLKIHAF